MATNLVVDATSHVRQLTSSERKVGQMKKMKVCLVLLIAIALPTLARADGDRLTLGWLHAVSHVVGNAVAPQPVVVAQPAPVYVQPAPQPTVVYVQQPAPVVYAQPAPQQVVVQQAPVAPPPQTVVVEQPAPVMVQPPPQPMVVVQPAPVAYVPESYVWVGQTPYGWVGNQYCYWNGNGWYACRPEHMARFHEWERGHADYRSHAVHYERGHDLRREEPHR